MITVDKKTGKNNLGKRFHLDEIYNNPELYAAYPELSDVIVFAEDFNNDGTGGQTSVDADGNIEIAINYNSILNAYRDYRNPKRTLVHEIQHAIQIIEGFSYGGSPATVKEILRDNINAAEEALSKTAKGTSKYQRIQKSIDELKRAENSSDDEETLEDLYWNLGGEQEAREVETRMVSAVARKYSPIIHNYDALIVFGGEEYPMARIVSPENKKAATTDENMSPKENVKQKLLSLVGKPITNKATGIVALINVKQINEMLSNRAVNKSINNGFTQAQHLEATENIKKLYEDATLTLTRPDEKKTPGSQGLKSIKIFHCDTKVAGEDAVAKLTVKESFQHGHRVYSIELEELNKPAELKNRTGTDSSAGSESSTQKGNMSSSRYAEEPSNKNIPQGEEEIKYSIGRSDNSSESLSQKIRNSFATWWKGDPKKNRNREITDLLYRTTGYKVDFGNVKDADQTIIDDVHKVIRTKHAYEWDKLLPQIGGKIAKSLKLNPTQEMSNYIADWCLTGAVGNTSAEAKAFEKAMRNDPVTAGLMLQIRDAFQEFHDMTAQEKIGDTLVSRLQGKSPKEIARELWGEKEEQITDDLHPVLRQVNEMIAKAEKTSPTLAKLMKEDINPYQLMRLLRGVGGLGDLMIGTKAKNIEDTRNQFRTLYPRLKFDRLISLDMIVDMAGGKEHVEGLMKYAVAKLDKEMHEKLRADPKSDLRPQFSEAVDDEVIQAGEKQYAAAHRALITYSNILACIQHDAGLITDSEFGKLMKGWKNYVPMIRVFEDGEEFKLADSLKPKTGSKRNTYNIWETLTQNTYAALSRAERNKTIQQLAFYARIGEFGDIVQEVETSNPSKNIIHFRENGEIKYLKVFDPAVVRAVENIYSPADTAWIMKFLKATMSFVRAMRTLASADFAIGNPFRDMQDAFIHNRHADANPFVALLNAFREGFKGFGFKRMFKEKSLVPHDTDWAEFNALGGTQSTFVSEDVDQLRRSMNKIYRKTFKESFKEAPLFTVLDKMQWLSEQTEYMTRLNSYKRAKAELARQRPDGKATLADKRLAALEARDASIDFAKAGTSTRKFNRLVMFANAQVQDWAKWGVIGRDLFKGGEARKVALQKIGRTMLTGVLAALLQAALNYSDDDRREKYKKRPDWEKETYWIFADGLRIPKGQDIGTRFVSALTDEFIGKAMDDDPVSAKRILKVIKNAIPSIIPSLIEPAYEVHMNYSSFRDAPIVPVGQQNLDKAAQYGKNTSSFAKLFGEMTGWISPRGVDYLISGYLGSTGKFLTRLPDYFTRGGTIDDVLMLRRFVFDPNENPKTVKDYYEAYNEQYKHYNTYKLQRKWDKNAQPPDGYDPKLYARLKSVSSTLRKISAAENNILRNPNLDWDTKNEKLRELEKKRERLCQRAMQQAH